MSSWGPQQTSAFGGFSGQGTTGAGGMFGNKAQPQATMFGGQQQQPKTLYGNAQTQQPTMGGFGVGVQPAGMGLFGQKPAIQNFAQPGTFGQPLNTGTQPNTMFGGGQATFGAQGGQSTFGQLGVQQQASGFSQGLSGFNQSPGFGTGAPATFGQPVTAFSAGVGQQPGLFGAGAQNTGIANAGVFGQAATSQFNQSAFGGAQTQTGLFGNQQQTIFGGQQQPSQNQNIIYAQPSSYPQAIDTFQVNFNMINQQIKENSTSSNMNFHTLRIQPPFDKVSSEMIRVIDLAKNKGLQIPSYEYTALQEFQSNRNNYTLLQKLCEKMSGQETSSSGVQPQQSFGLTGGSFNQLNQAQKPGVFGQVPQQAAGGGLFSQATPAPTTGFGTFGQTAANQSFQGLSGQTQPQVFGGQTAQSSGTGMFGGAQQSPSPQFGGQTQGQGFGGQASPLFGGQQQQPAQAASGGMFGQAQQPQKTSLFSQAAAQPVNNLFGGQAAQPQMGAGLFGQKPPETGTGLFSGQQQSQAQPQQQLFGGQQQTQVAGTFKPATGSTLFGGQTASQPGSLFGGQKPATASQSTLFGGQTGGSLFGQQTTTTAQPVGGLFSQPAAAGAAPLGADQQYAQFYSSSDPFNLQNSFLSTPCPLAEVQKELELLKKQASEKDDKKHQDFSYSDMQSQFAEPQISFSLQIGIPTKILLEEEDRRQKAKMKAKYGAESERSRREYIELLHKESHRKPKSNIGFDHLLSFSREPDDSSFTQERAHLERSLPQISVLSQSQRSTQLISIRAKYENQELEFQINKMRAVKDVLSRVRDWLIQQKSVDKDAEIEILLKQRALDASLTLKDAGIEDNVDIEVGLKAKPVPMNKWPQTVKETEIDSEEVLAPKERVPKPPKDGYKTSPDMTELSRMTLKQLKNVPHFKVWNDFGEIQFIGQTDLLDINLADLITLSQGSCEVYDDARHALTKPPVGQKLNKPSFIKLNNVRPRKNGSNDAWEAKLISSLGKDSEHLSFDRISYDWQFKVEHFTRWGVSTDDSDEEMSSEPPKSASVDENKPATKTYLFETNEALQPVPDDSMEDVVSLTSGQESQFQIGKRIKMVLPYHEKPVKSQVFVVKKEEPQRIVFKKPLTLLPEPFGASSNEKNEVLKRISNRETVIQQCSYLECKVPSNNETVEYLKTLDIKNVAKTSLRQRKQFSAAFSPNGKLAFAVKNKISIVSVNTQPSQVDFSTLLKEFATKENEFSINTQMQRMSLSQKDQPMQELVLWRNLNMPDAFMDSLLNMKLPQFSLFNEATASNQQSNVKYNKFLYSLAQFLARKQDPKLEHEFFVVCMLNALFGNPNIQLVQLHLQFKGAFKSLDHASKVFLDSDFDNSDHVRTSQKRKNNLIEVLRFYCARQFPVLAPEINNFDSNFVYGRALQLLKNGQIREAVKHLQLKQKNKLAMCIAQSVSAPGRVQGFHSAFTNTFDNTSHPILNRILSVIAGQPDQNDSWQQIMLCRLLFAEDQGASLKQTLSNVNFEESGVVWNIIKVFCGEQQALSEIEGFKANFTPTSSGRDLRLRWLVTLLLRHALKHQEENSVSMSDQLPLKIKDSSFFDVSAKYVSQLQHEGDWSCALYVAMLLPQSGIRHRLVFEILCQQPLEFYERRNTLFSEFSLPQAWVDTSLALLLQKQGLTGSACEEWIKISNFNQANHLLYYHLLPLYMNKTNSVALLKALSLSMVQDLTLLEQTRLVEQSGLCPELPQVLDLVNKLFLNGHKIDNFSSTTDILKKFVNLLESLKSSSLKANDLLIRAEEVVTKCNSKATSDPVLEFIMEETVAVLSHLKANKMLNLNRQVKLNIDDLSARQDLERRMASSISFPTKNLALMNAPLCTRSAEYLAVTSLVCFE